MKPELENALHEAERFIQTDKEKHFPTVATLETTTLEVMEGPTWTRIVAVTTSNTTGQVISRSAWGFVDNDGNLWKAAGWKAPAKNKARGTIADLHNPANFTTRRWVYGIQ